MAPKIDPWVRTFTVSDPLRHRKGYTVYKVTSKVFPRNSPEAATEIIVWKRYSDFKKLHKNLQVLHAKLYLKGSFPAFAKGRLFGRFDENVVEERRLSALRLLEFVAIQPPLFNSQLFVKFFEDGERRNPERITETESDKTPILHPPNGEEVTDKDNFSLIKEPKVEDVNRTLLLGGIWQFRQDQESISVSSGSSGTSPLDEDSTLSLFDPLRNTSVDKGSCSSSWFLAALEACNGDGRSANSGSIPSPFPYPKPFAEFDDSPPIARSLLVDVSPPRYLCGWDAVVQSKAKPISTAGSSSVGGQSESNLLLDLGTEPFQSPVNLNCSGTDDEYILAAADTISLANEKEADANYKEAFSLYKIGVGTLLKGVQDDTDETRKEAIRRKMAQYLSRAEEIYEKYLSTPYYNAKQNQLQLTKEPLMGMLQAPVSDLRNYRVLGVLDKVLLVLDTTTDRTFVMKVLHKASSSHSLSVPSVVPSKHRFMVQLYKFIETDYGIFLVLQHAAGGKLWQYVKNYLQNSPSSPSQEYSGCDPLVIHVDQVPTNTKNVYSGRKLLEDDNDENAIEKERLSSAEAALDLIAMPECATSYVELFTTYAASLQAGNVVELAKCNIKHSQPGGSTNGSCTSLKDIDIPIRQTPQYEDQSVDTIDFDQKVVRDSFPPVNSEENRQVVREPLPDDVGELNSQDLITCAQELLQNVDETLRESQRADESSSAFEGFALQQVEPVPLRQPQSSSDTSSRSRRSSRRRTSSIMSRQQSEDSAFSSPIHEARRSSSTGSLPTAVPVRPRQRYLSEVFQQLDDANRRELRLPESCIRTWAAEIVIAVSQLHSLGIICRDLCPDNILLGSRGHILLTHFGQWGCVERIVRQDTIDNLYAAPEVSGIAQVTAACDWWSVGALLFELLTGKSLVSCHPGGINSHTELNVSTIVSAEAHSLLKELLRFNARERLGASPNGVEDLRSHSFFVGYDWNQFTVTDNED